MLLAPEYHARNFEQGLVANFAGGVTASDYKLAMASKTEPNKIISLRDGDITTGELLAEFKASGARQSFTGSVLEAPKKARKTPFQWNRLLGEAVEIANRFPLYVHARRLGMSPLEAAKYVNKYHFNYLHKTTFERKVLGRVFPFISWYKENARFWIKALTTGDFQTLAKYAVARGVGRQLIARAMAGLSGSKYIRENEVPFYDQLPDWLRRPSVLIYAYNPKTKILKYVDLGGPFHADNLLPYVGSSAPGIEDVTFRKPAEDVLQQITPFFGLGLNAAFGSAPIGGSIRPAARYPGAAKLWAGQRWPARIGGQGAPAGAYLGQGPYQGEAQKVLGKISQFPGSVVLNQPLLSNLFPGARLLNVVFRDPEDRDLEYWEKLFQTAGFRPRVVNLAEAVSGAVRQKVNEFFAPIRDLKKEAKKRALTGQPIDIPESEPRLPRPGKEGSLLDYLRNKRKKK